VGFCQDKEREKFARRDTDTIRRHRTSCHSTSVPDPSRLADLPFADRFAAQHRNEPTIGALPCDTVPFPVLVLGTAALLVGPLCFLPALAPVSSTDTSKRRPSCIMQGPEGKLQRPQGDRPPGSGHNSLARDAL
jgi:hypothetical protein